MRDPYEVLGVPRGAAEADIKKAWRKLAKQHHPDHNRNDPKSADKLAAVNSAYEILGDKEKRAQFDRGEIDAEGKPRFAGFEGFGGGQRPGRGGFEFEFGRGGRAGATRIDPSDLFSDLFGAFTGARGQGRAEASFGKGADASASLTVSFVEAAKGATKRVRLPSGREVDIAVPPGTENGRTMRLRGQGFPAPGGGEAGDALVTVVVEPDPLFQADGLDLRLDLPVSVDEAVLGATVRVPTLDGMVELRIPAGSNSGRTLRLKGKGLPSAQGAGDLYVRLLVVLPETDDDLRAYAEGLRARSAASPRGPAFER
jgi:DnaJ-class molecular chaperone